MNEQRLLFGGRPVLSFREESDRRRFLRSAALVGVGGSLAYALKTDPVSFADGDEGAAGATGGDLEILNYALTLEYLEAEYYAQGIQRGILSGRELELVTPIADHERIHVEALTATINDLGGTPVAKPTFTIPDDTYGGRDAFLQTAGAFEELGVTAYHGQVPLIASPAILGAAASIAGVESRHAAIIAQLLGGDPFPAVIEASATREQVLAAAGSFIGA